MRAKIRIIFERVHKRDGSFCNSGGSVLPVPMILYPPKVSSERPIDESGTGGKNVWDDPEMTSEQSGVRRYECDSIFPYFDRNNFTTHLLISTT